MKINFSTLIMALIVLTLAVLGFVLGGVNLSQNQLDTLLILGIVCGAAVLYCFIVGEISGNNSQMDKLWSLLPIAYAWIVTAKGGFKIRLIIMALIVTFWGIRLTYNFARKGAYKLKFWEGREDYRWEIVRKSKVFQNRFAWAMFDLLFISLYQNVLVLGMTLPMLALMDSTADLGILDYVAAVLACSFLLLETAADEQQWKFHETKRKLLLEFKELSEIEYPYSLGFNTTGIWKHSRHPNYLGEQGIWVSLYIFTIAAGVTRYGVFNWTLIGSMLIVFLFLCSSILGENISSGKYPDYKYYQCYVSKYIPLWKYDEEKAKEKYNKKNA